MNYHKILVIGCCGSGKSTLARKLEYKTGLPLIHLDREYYRANWEKPTKDEWNEKVLNLCQNERFIMDGNYISSLKNRLDYADMIIWIDVNRITCLKRAIIRVLTPSKRQRTDMGSGCVERHDLSFYKFIWNFNKTIKPQIIKILENHKDMKVVVLRSKRSIRKFISTYNQMR